MRIVSGKLKGKRIIAPGKLPVRPTTDFAKEGLFNILNNRFFFDEIRVLDLFSGTGNISFEFASRGTTDITAVDAHYGCVKFISDTASSLFLPIKTIKSDVVKYLQVPQQAYDIIFADPPYNFTLEQMETLSTEVFKNGLLNQNGLLILEHSKHLSLDHLNEFSEARRYGGSVFSFFEHVN